MFYFEILPDFLCYICFWLPIDTRLLYLEKTTVFMVVISCSFVGPWNYSLTLNIKLLCVAQKKLVTADPNQ